MTAKEVITALARRHPGRDWGFFVELRVGTGYRYSSFTNGVPYNPEQRLDAFAIHLWPSKKWQRVAYEVKVSRSDFLDELKHPEKRQTALALSNEFFFAVPAGLVQATEIPEECGLITVKDGWGTVVKKAPSRPAEDPPLTFLATIARRAANPYDVHHLREERRQWEERYWERGRELARLKDTEAVMSVLAVTSQG